jgi:hypothetical protein
MRQMDDYELELLLEVVEVHYQCFQKHYPEYNVTYENVLELNHKKILGLAEDLEESDFDDGIITFILNGLLSDYTKILRRENPYSDEEF